MRKICLVISIIMSLTVFGCSKQQSMPLNSFYYENIVGVDGSITQNIGIPLLEEDILKQNSNAEFENYEKELCKVVEEKIFNNIYINYWLKKIEAGNSQTENVVFVKPYLNEGRIVVSVKYLKTKDTDNSKNNTFDGIKFIDKQEVNKTFAFDETNDDGKSLGELYTELLKEVIKNNFKEINLDELNYSFEYRYVTSYSQIKSNADYRVYLNNNYIHSWIKGKGDFDSKSVKIWVNIINAGWWYLSILLGTIILGAVIYFKIFLKSNKKRYSL